MKTDQVNLRLEADLIAALETAAREESLDRGTMIRKLLREALGQRHIERALVRYQRGEISIGRAAEEASTNHWDLLQLIRARGIAYPLTPEEAESRLVRLIGRAPRVAEQGPGYAATIESMLDGERTLPDRPPSRGGILLVGINPAPASVKVRHYYQGPLGRRLWRRLARLGLLLNAVPGQEDDAFVEAGHGLTDIVKRPTRSATELDREELKLGVEGLRAKVRSWSPRLILFAFREAARAVVGRSVAPGPCSSFEGVPTFLLSGPYASRTEADRVDAVLLELVGDRAVENARVLLTQPVTPSDISNGQIRLPREAKRMLLPARGPVDVLLRGVRLRASYDPRRGKDRERSAVLRIGRSMLERVVRPRERLRIRIGSDGLVHLD